MLWFYSLRTALSNALCESIRYQAKSEQNVQRDLIPRVRHGDKCRVKYCNTHVWRMVVVSQFNGTSTPKGSYGAKTGDNDCNVNSSHYSQSTALCESNSQSGPVLIPRVRNGEAALMHPFMSEEFSVEKGVRQGDVLSPLLSNIFINDLCNRTGRLSRTQREVTKCYEAKETFQTHTWFYGHFQSN